MCYVQSHSGDGHVRAKCSTFCIALAQAHPTMPYILLVTIESTESTIVSSFSTCLSMPIRPVEYGVAASFCVLDMQQKAQEEVTVKSKNTVHDEVTLDKLSLMKLPNGERVKIIETIAKDWRIVGCQLNFDRAGNRLSLINKQELNNPIACCEAMFQHWLNGNGVKPATWKTLIDILEDCDYIALKEQVERAFSH